MAHLSIGVLGPFQASLDGQPLSGFASDKVRALLTYLALSPNRPHRRETLAGLLWPDFPERSARTNLRNTLANLRQVIRDQDAAHPFLDSNRQTIQFNGQSDYWLDADAFEGLASTVSPTSEGLEQAVGLVRGQFLEGFSLADAAPFEEWLLLRREHSARQLIEGLQSLAQIYERRSDYVRALAHTRRRVDLEPWQEDGQRQLMRLLAQSGQRSQALAQYEALCRSLRDELGADPAAETTVLLGQIRQGKDLFSAAEPARPLDCQPPARLPGFLKQEADAVEPPVFVTRERELARLEAHLDETLEGRGHAVFVTGGPGRGKTALLSEFGRRAMEANPDLLVAQGNCNAYSGVGDPYLPFRDLLAMLTGDVEARWLAGAVSTQQARRLWDTMPVVIKSMLQRGPHLTGVLVNGQALLSRAGLWCATSTAGPASAAQLYRVRERIESRRTGGQATDQNQLFHQVANLLRDLAETHPLLLVVDDLQWADTASISLLFHLGRRLEGARILIAGAYRAEEVAMGRSSSGSQRAERHPLEKVVSEFKRTSGEVGLDLAEAKVAEQRRFVDALMEAEPNRLGEGFREALAARAGGHPLFTVELLRTMQERGDLIRDAAGRWVEGSVLDWETLPVRVEGVIEERISRLDPELREVLSAASVEGEYFSVPVVARIRGMDEQHLLPRLAQDLERRHRLVAELAEMRVGQERISRFRFGHILVQSYLYQQLSRGERRLLHGQVAEALERCYGEHRADHAVTLAFHYDRAGDDGRALTWFSLAAENARRSFANEEAFSHYARAIEVAGHVRPDAGTLAKLHRGRGLVCEVLGRFEQADSDHRTILKIGHAAGEVRFVWRAHLDLGKLWASRDYAQARLHFERALTMARQMDEPALLAESLNGMGNWYANANDTVTAVGHHREALTIVEKLEDQQAVADTLDLLGLAHLLGADLTACVPIYDRSIALCRELEDRPRLVTGLIARAVTVSELVLLATVPATGPSDPLGDMEEALRITRDIGSTPDLTWGHWALGRLHLVQGRYGPALEALERGLRIAREMGHREYEVTNLVALGGFFAELLAPEEARRHLEPAWALAQELRSQLWFQRIPGALAGVSLLSNDLVGAETYLAKALTEKKPMDTAGNRYCWARRAELALAQGSPGLALDIADRLTASAPGMSPGRVIPFVWQLKGEALAGSGHPEEGLTFLQEAMEGAKATGQRFLLWRMHSSMGRLYLTLDQPPDAEKEFATARRLVDELAGSLPHGKFRDSFQQRAYTRVGSAGDLG